MTDLISHDDARNAVAKIARAANLDLQHDPDVILIASYTFQCEATSRDLKNMIVAVLELGGPEMLKNVSDQVVAGRMVVKKKN